MNDWIKIIQNIKTCDCANRKLHYSFVFYKIKTKMHEQKQKRNKVLKNQKLQQHIQKIYFWIVEFKCIVRKNPKDSLTDQKVSWVFFLKIHLNIVLLIAESVWICQMWTKDKWLKQRTLWGHVTRSKKNVQTFYSAPADWENLVLPRTCSRHSHWSQVLMS